LNILYLSPSLRKRYIDILLSQTDKKYLATLIKYNKSLKQRNVLLDEIRKAKFNNKNLQPLFKDLSAWNDELIEFGSLITEKRLELVKFFSEKLENFYQSISGKKEKISVKYKSKVVNEKDAFPLNKISFISQAYTDAMIQSEERDIMQAKTTVGPHRDDLVFFIDKKEITSVASRGEFRTLLLAIKLVEIEFIKEKTGSSPMLLLDDVFSELDKTRQEKLLKSIKNCQTIIATTDMDNLGELAATSAFIELEKKA